MIQTAIYYSNNSSIYPGEYEPLPGQAKELYDKLESKTCVTIPAIRVKELKDQYRIEIPAPGFKRQDFVINTNGETLSIAGMTKKTSQKEQGGEDFDEFHYQYIKRDINLPPDVDTEFAIAEYANGILCISLFRTSHPIINRPGNIIVY